MVRATIQIQNGNIIQEVIALDEINWELSRRKTPGKLTFSVLKDDLLNFTEGNQVKLTVDGKNLFYGFVTSKQRNDNDVINVTALDQLFYLKLKDTYVYSGKSASDLVRIIANDFRLNVGTLENTRHTMSGVDDNKELFEIIQNALDETTSITGEIFTLYDDFGKLTIKNISNMRSNILIDQETAQSFDYTTSIEGNTYNRIKLVYDDKENGVREVYIAQSTASQNQWGILQLYDTLEKGGNGQVKANTLLANHNKRSRTLSINEAFGDVNVRAGTLIPIKLNIGDVELANYMVVENVKHTFKDNEHTMTMTVIGGEFGGS